MNTDKNVIQLLVHYDDIDGIAPVLVQTWFENEKLHISTDTLHLSLNAADIRKIIKQNDNINNIIKDILKLKTLRIPSLGNGIPYVRLDQIADIFKYYLPETNVNDIYVKIYEEKTKYE